MKIKVIFSILFILLFVLNVGAFEDYYKLMGLKEDATTKEIKKEFRKLSLENHPDKKKSKESTIFYTKLTEAYSILSDKDLRRDYDRELEFFRKHGEFLHTVSYEYKRKLKKLTLIEAIIPVIVIFTILQYYYMYSRHYSDHKRIKESQFYKEKVKQVQNQNRRKKLSKSAESELESEEPVVIIEGSELPTWRDLTIIQLALFPYFIYLFLEKRKKKNEELQKRIEEHKKYLESLTEEERKQLKRSYAKRYWKKQFR